MASETASFPGVIGHRRVSAMLSRAIARSRLHHGLVLAGPRGIGKATLARGLACALCCRVSPAIGCGRCDTCRRLLSGNHTDLRWLEGEGKSRTILAEAAREAALRAQHAPFEGPAHVIVIDPADRMQPAAAAALLKAIEEPRAGVYWVLIATNLHDVLDTIRSRCMTIPLERLAEQDLRAVIDRALHERGLAESIDRERLELAINLADGSPGLALELASDPSLEPTRKLLANTLSAVSAGPSAVFAGDRSSLWLAWKDALAATSDPSEQQTAASEPEVVVVESKGKKGAKATKKASKKSADKSSKKDGEDGEGKESAARQRAAAMRLAELWLLHLRERLLGREGLRGMPALRGHEDLAAQMQAVQRFQTGLARNPNVRLSLEQLLLELGR